MDSHERIVHIIKSIPALPTFPGIVSEIVGLIDDPMSSASDLARHMDPSMCSEVLRIANTAYFGTKSFRSIVTVERAIAVIGYERLSLIILQMPFLSLLHRGRGEFDKYAFMRHAIVSGVLARSIGLHAYRQGHNEAYICGILHDIGKIVIHQLFRDDWRQIDLLMKTDLVPRDEAERQVLGMDHGMLGGLLLDMWNIPEAISDGVKFHHSPESSTAHRRMAMATNLGNEFSKRIDLATDLEDFDDFLVKHRDLSNCLKEDDSEVSASEELRFFSAIYDSLKSAELFFEHTIREENDTSTGS